MNPNNSQIHILIISAAEDEISILQLALQRIGAIVSSLSSSREAISSWEHSPPDVIILASEQEDFIGTVKEFRQATIVPILILIDSIREEEHINALESGADLIVVRPYSTRLLVSQIKVMVRHGPITPSPLLHALQFGRVVLNPELRVVIIDDVEKKLSTLEFEILQLLITHKGRPLPARFIADRVWPYIDGGDVTLVRGVINRLRKKIEPDPANPRYILTLPQQGYYWNPEI